MSVPVVAELPEDCRGRWESFVDETLRETNRRNTVELVRLGPAVSEQLLSASQQIRFFFSNVSFNKS